MTQSDVIKYLQEKGDYASAQEIGKALGINAGSVRENLHKIIRWGEKTNHPIIEVKKALKEPNEARKNKIYIFVYKLLK